MEPFEMETYELKRSLLPVAVLVGVLLFVVGGLIDYLMIPTYFQLSLVLRSCAIGGALALLSVTRKRQLSPAGLDRFLLLILYGGALVLAILVRVSGGYKSIYMEGLVELVLFWGVIFPWKPREYAIHLLAVWGVYLLPSLVLDRPFGTESDVFFFKNLEYLIFSGICLTAIAVNYSLRRQEYLQRTRLDRITRTDELTQTLNYRGFWRDLQECVEMGRASNYRFSLLLIDLDNFKVFNDMRGHLMGDTLLRDTGAILKNSVRSSDMVYRQGGDEFAIILPYSDAAVTHEVVRRISDNFYYHMARRGVIGQVGLSIGIAEFPTDGTTAEELFKQADLNLFQQKTSKKMCANP